LLVFGNKCRLDKVITVQKAIVQTLFNPLHQLEKSGGIYRPLTKNETGFRAASQLSSKQSVARQQIAEVDSTSRFPRARNLL
jgi:hypothetical protein